MLDLGTTEFVLAIPSLPEAELKRLSTSLFAEWEEFVDTALSLPDYSLLLQVEEGSVRGAAKIGAVAGALFLGIANYGDFIGGVRTIGEQISATGDFVAEQAKQFFDCPDSKATARKRGGTVSGLQRLFVRVQKGELSPEEAMHLADKLLGEERNTAPGFMEALSDAFRDCPRFHKQEPLPFLEGPDDQLHPLALPPSLPPAPRETRPRVELGPPLQLRVEVWRDSKKKRRKTRVVKL
jgi:hypothetical protein